MITIIAPFIWILYGGINDYYNERMFYLAYAVTVRSEKERKQAEDKCALMGGAGYLVDEGLMTNVVYAAYEAEDEAIAKLAGLGEGAGIMYVRAPRMSHSSRGAIRKCAALRRLYESLCDFVEDTFRLQDGFWRAEMETKEAWRSLDLWREKLESLTAFAISEPMRSAAFSAVVEGAKSCIGAIEEAKSSLYNTMLATRHISTLAIKAALVFSEMREKLG